MKDHANGLEEGRTAQREAKGAPKVWIKNQVVRIGLAETLCTYVMMVFGLGSVAQVILGSGAFGDFFSINVGFGLGVAMGVHVGGKVSGAHMNAAVSFTMCVFGRLKWTMLPLYIFTQFLGSFLAAGTIFSLYYDAIVQYGEGNFTVTGPKATAGIFATYPAPYLSLHSGFLDQVVGTAMLLLCLMALSDQRNKPAPAGSEPLAVGLVVILIGISLGSNAGYPINPTRDLAPRVFSAIAGWGPEVFKAGRGWWWVPVLAPLVGGVLGASIYRVLVEMHHPSLHKHEDGNRRDPEDQPLEQLKKKTVAEMCV